MIHSRRDVLKLGLSTAALCAAGQAVPHVWAGTSTKLPIGLQLYSVRKECAKDLPAVLAAVAKMGYQGVEFAGYYGYDKKPQELRKLLDDNGLKCCGTHTGLTTIQGDALKATVELHQILGNKFLIVPGLPAKSVASKEALIETAKLFTEAAAKVKDQGMRVGYHAHGPDFKKIDDLTHWEIIFDHAGPDVVMQMDVGNCLGGGGDPYAMLRKYPGRSATVHLKEHGGPKGAPVGEGEVKWKEVFELCETIGKTEWYIVEHESGTAPLEAVDTCLKNLHKMGK